MEEWHMKPIKFNLQVDGKIIRSFDELKSNFNIDDVYDLYNKRILQKWLRLQNELAMAEALDQVPTENPKIAIETILTLFGYDAKEMQTEIYAHLYSQTHRKEVARSIVEKKSHYEIIAKHHKNYLFLKQALHHFKIVHNFHEVQGFDNLTAHYEDEMLTSKFIEEVQRMIKHSLHMNQNRASSSIYDRSKNGSTTSAQWTEEPMTSIEHSYSAIQSTVNEIGTNYLELLRLDLITFCSEFFEENPIVIMACLMHPEIRDLIMDNSQIKPVLRELFDELEESKTMINLLPYCKHYEGDTEGMWKYLGDPDKQYLVLYISPGQSRVGEQLNLREEYNYLQVNGQYLILNGLTFKSASDEQSIVYLEV